MNMKYIGTITQEEFEDLERHDRMGIPSEHKFAEWWAIGRTSKPELFSRRDVNTENLLLFVNPPNPTFI